MSNPIYLDDDLNHLLTSLPAVDEEAWAEDKEYQTELCAAVIIAAELGEQIRIKHRHDSRFYLWRAQLLPNPRINTPWQTLYESQDDRAFITTMGFDVETFGYILTSGSLDSTGALGLVLHYLNSTMHEISLQQIFAIIPSTVSRYITFGLSILLSTLQKMPEGQICWPQHDEFDELSQLVTQRHSRLTGAFGSIDGLKLPVQTSEDLDIENATFNGWLSEHFVSSVIVFSSKGEIIAANLNAPGSWHDSRVAQPIYATLRTRTPDGYYLVADTAFPRGTGDIVGQIRTTLKDGQRIAGTPDQILEAMAHNWELLSYRQTAEWGMRAIQGSFGRLQMPLNIDHDERRGNLIEVCLWLHNMRTVKIGINQIHTMYVPNWQQTEEDQEVWTGFANMLFSDQIKKDRVSRFHVTLEYQN
ncbi:hypothetical protein SCLCIDRAFT_30069 [Scleroderma citrinum Foug A]|uniref:DDE Tnp4 domain-containing protein n=1 Tax=Scleroderma citrinum Foug A TaxID=1036808 RepID=A0A0C2ZTC8_9AGAM|nr:hypothetical protein SCLCIDRAFT_30069 [Scleroderma citrinum Foug A]